MVRVQARVTWEESGRAPLVLFASTDERHHEALSLDPNAFLIACLLPAWHAGERRVRIDGQLCPVLCQNMTAALATLSSWYPARFGPAPAIEPSSGFKVN